MTYDFNPDLPPFNYDWIDERVMAGRNPLTRGDVELLQSFGITHILDLREPHEWAPPRYGTEAIEAVEHCGLQRLNLVVTDLGAPSPTVFDAAFAFIETSLENPEARVFVHCRAGMERTAAVVVAWFARRNGVSYEESLATLRERRPLLRPLYGQERAARGWLER